MKTIFITCFTGLISRNILATDTLEILRREPSLRIVIITSASRAAALARDFGGPNVVVEALATPPLAGIERLLWIVATNLLSTRTRQVQRRAKYEFDRKRFDYWSSFLFSLLGRAKIVRMFFRWAARHLDSGQETIFLFDRYQPALLLATDVYTPWDVKFMRQAERRGVAIVGMVRSWDNVTSKTLLQFIPERLVVSTERIKEEAQRLGDVPAERIHLVGIPHYDRYRALGRTPRHVFCARLGLDPAEPFVLFTPPSDNYLKADSITPLALEAIARTGAAVLVRMPLVGQAILGAYRPPQNVIFDSPGRSPDFTEVHLSRQADQHLADSIYHSVLVVTWASTMIIDAAVFNKPILLVGFDAAPRPYGKSITRYYDYNHQRRIIELGGARLVSSPEELTSEVRAAILHPERDRLGREAIVREYCGTLDGRAGERLGRYLLGCL